MSRKEVDLDLSGKITSKQPVTQKKSSSKISYIFGGIIIGMIIVLIGFIIYSVLKEKFKKCSCACGLKESECTCPKNRISDSARSMCNRYTSSLTNSDDQNIVTPVIVKPVVRPTDVNRAEVQIVQNPTSGGTTGVRTNVVAGGYTPVDGTTGGVSTLVQGGTNTGGTTSGRTNVVGGTTSGQTNVVQGGTSTGGTTTIVGGTTTGGNTTIVGGNITEGNNTVVRGDVTRTFIPKPSLIPRGRTDVISKPSTKGGEQIYYNKPELYLYDEGTYTMNFVDSQKKAIELNEKYRNYGVTKLAGDADVVTGQQAGADWCRWGWIDDGKTLAYPIAKGSPFNCGDNKIDRSSYPLNIPSVAVSAIMYGPKPPKSDLPECPSPRLPDGTLGKPCQMAFSSKKWSQYDPDP